MTAFLAMKQALEFIEQHSKYWNGTGEHPQEIATKLKGAIKQMESAPVYQWRDTRSDETAVWKDAPAHWYNEWRTHPYYEWRVLYAVDALGNTCESECVACVGCKP